MLLALADNQVYLAASQKPIKFHHLAILINADSWLHFKWPIKYMVG